MIEPSPIHGGRRIEIYGGTYKNLVTVPGETLEEASVSLHVYDERVIVLCARGIEGEDGFRLCESIDVYESMKIRLPQKNQENDDALPQFLLDQLDPDGSEPYNKVLKQTGLVDDKEIVNEVSGADYGWDDPQAASEGGDAAAANGGNDTPEPWVPHKAYFLPEIAVSYERMPRVFLLTYSQYIRLSPQQLPRHLMTNTGGSTAETLVSMITGDTDNLRD